MRNQLVVLIAVIFVSGCITGNAVSPYQKDYAGLTVNFRANIVEAEKVSLKSSEKDIQVSLLSPYVKEIKIAFVPSDTNNKFYGVTGYELGYKMQVIRLANYEQSTPISSLILNKTEEAIKLATPEKPIILMQADADNTEVHREGYVIYVRGKDMTENARDYTDLDLAADKLLLTLMKSGQ